MASAKKVRRDPGVVDPREVRRDLSLDATRRDAWTIHDLEVVPLDVVYADKLHEHASHFAEGIAIGKAMIKRQQASDAKKTPAQLARGKPPAKWTSMEEDEETKRIRHKDPTTYASDMVVRLNGRYDSPEKMTRAMKSYEDSERSALVKAERDARRFHPRYARKPYSASEGARAEKKKRVRSEFAAERAADEAQFYAEERKLEEERSLEARRAEAANPRRSQRLDSKRKTPIASKLTFV